MYRIVIIEGTSKLGGAQFDNLLIQQSVQDKIDYITLCLEEGDLVEKLRSNGRQVELLKLRKSIKTSFLINEKAYLNPLAVFANFLIFLDQAFKIKRWCVRNKVDLIVTNGMAVHISGGLAAILSKKPVVFRLMDVIREDLFLGKGRLFFQKYCQLIKAKVIVPSNAVAKAMFDYSFIENNVTTIYNATDSALFNYEKTEKVLRQEYNIPSNAIVFGCYSRLIPWKGQRQFISAAINIINKSENTYFFIVGGSLFGTNTFMNSLKNLVKDNNCEEKIIFTGFRYDMANCLESSDIVVVPSILPDPCPRIMVESMSLKKPLIGSNLGGIPEVIEDNKTGYIYNSNDLIELEEKMMEFIKNPSKIKKFGEAGYLRQAEKYKLSDYQKIHESAFIKAIHKN